MAQADYLGRKAKGKDNLSLSDEYSQRNDVLQKMLRTNKARMKEPYLMGRDLIDAGIKPGPIFHKAMAYTHKLRLAGRSKEEQLSQALGFIRKETEDAEKK